MPVRLAKDSIDIGIVVRDAAAALRFYCDVLGFEDEGERLVPGGSLRRVRCGNSLIKIVSPDRAPAVAAPGGRIDAATGFRYLTISVADLADTVATCEAANADVALQPTELRPGVMVALVRDPDGNWIEFVQSQEN